MTEHGVFKNNCFNTFRLLAAIQVLWFHTLRHLELSNIPVLGDILEIFLGVPIFFSLSGFLIWQSIGRSRTFFDFAIKRFWRLYPELWVAVAVEIIVLLVLYHQPIDFLQMGLFTIGQATVFQFWTPDCLRGYGCGCPNGALWTIPVFIQFYLTAYFVYGWIHNRKSYVWVGLLVASLSIAWLTPAIMSLLPVIIGKIYSVSLFPYLWMFLIPAFVSERYDVILPFLKNYWWAFLLALLISYYLLNFDIYLGIYPLLGTLLLFGFFAGFAYRFPQVNIKTDISYGVYIYHMTFVNALLALGYVGQSWTLWFVIGATCLLAWISTVMAMRLIKIKKNK